MARTLASRNALPSGSRLLRTDPGVLACPATTPGILRAPGLTPSAARSAPALTLRLFVLQETARASFDWCCVDTDSHSPQLTSKGRLLPGVYSLQPERDGEMLKATLEYGASINHFPADSGSRQNREWGPHTTPRNGLQVPCVGSAGSGISFQGSATVHTTNLLDPRCQTFPGWYTKDNRPGQTQSVHAGLAMTRVGPEQMQPLALPSSLGSECTARVQAPCPVSPSAKHQRECTNTSRAGETDKHTHTEQDTHTHTNGQSGRDTYTLSQRRTDTQWQSRTEGHIHTHSRTDTPLGRTMQTDTHRQSGIDRHAHGQDGQMALRYRAGMARAQSPTECEVLSWQTRPADGATGSVSDTCRQHMNCVSPQ
nr:uncharacterized protein LOC125639696 [Caretta caretta]